MLCRREGAQQTNTRHFCVCVLRSKQTHAIFRVFVLLAKSLALDAPRNAPEIRAHKNIAHALVPTGRDATVLAVRFSRRTFFGFFRFSRSGADARDDGLALCTWVYALCYWI